MDERTTPDDVAEHVRLVEVATQADNDELLTDLLVRIYPTKGTQDS
jgi:hypothetical protein